MSVNPNHGNIFLARWGLIQSPFTISIVRGARYIYIDSSRGPPGLIQSPFTISTVRGARGEIIMGRVWLSGLAALSTSQVIQPGSNPPEVKKPRVISAESKKGKSYKAEVYFELCTQIRVSGLNECSSSTHFLFPVLVLRCCLVSSYLSRRPMMNGEMSLWGVSSRTWTCVSRLCDANYIYA